MEELKQRILRDGRCLDGGVLKVDSFVNHQIDPGLMMSAARELVRRFADAGINKVLTVEASGIAPATLVGCLLGVPVVFAKKNKPCTMDDNCYKASVYSFTKGTSYDVTVSREFLNSGDNILFVDDFLANGNAAKGMVEIARQAGATIAGMGFIIEKGFQHGREALSGTGIRIESLAIIRSLEGGVITLA